MKRHATSRYKTVRPRGLRLLHTFPSILLVVSLGLGSFATNGCVAIPAVMMTSAAVTAAAVVSEGEKLVQNPDTESSLMVRNETADNTSWGKTCKRQGALLEEDQRAEHAQQAARNHCSAGLHEPDAVGNPNVPKT